MHLAGGGGALATAARSFLNTDRSAGNILSLYPVWQPQADYCFLGTLVSDAPAWRFAPNGLLAKSADSLTLR